MTRLITIGVMLGLCLTASLLAQSAPDLATLTARVERAEQAAAPSLDARVGSSSERRERASELQEIKDDLAYLRVKTRRGERVTEAERGALSDRLERFATRHTGVTPRVTSSGSATEVPVGTELDVRLQGSLSSRTAQVEDRVEATTVVDLLRGDAVLIPAGSLLSGQVTAVDRATRTDRKGEMTVRFDALNSRGTTYPVRASVVQALESEGLKGEAGRIGAGAGVGAIIGGILGGFKGVLAGILVGGGGVIAATEGQDVTLPAGTILRVRLDTPLVVP